MRVSKLLCQSLWLLPVMALAVGCPTSSDGPLVAVTGRINYKGASLQSGYVVFVRDTNKGEQGPIAIGKIGFDGSYTLMTGDPAAAGAHPGHYRVTIAAVAPGTPLPGQNSAFPQMIIPTKYCDPDLSKLECEVKPHQANTINFDLN
jgi:hypothetical protein